MGISTKSLLDNMQSTTQKLIKPNSANPRVSVETEGKLDNEERDKHDMEKQLSA